MEYNIAYDLYWSALESEVDETVKTREINHISEFRELHEKTGLKYKSTIFNEEDSSYYFNFEIVDETRFLLAKIKYGL